MKYLYFAVGALVITSPQLAAAEPPTEAECVEMGIQYYKDIDAFPTLSTGEDAIEKVIDMCSRSPYAFGESQ